MGEPPGLAGAVKLTVACVLPGTADTFVGTPGTGADIGVTEFDAEDATEIPIAFVATTVNV
jgi:hypothetical protein